MGLFTGDFYSESLKMTTGLRVIFPDASNDVTPLFAGPPKVLYLLHGLSGNSGEWTRFSKIEYYAKKFNFIIIMPEVQRSFYCDTQMGADYFRYIADELPEICERWFRLGREKPYIAGESMGGYGAALIGLRRMERFAGIACLSGVLDIQAFAARIMAGKWPDMAPKEMELLFGAQGPGREYDVISLGQKAAQAPNRPRLIQLCGTEDFLHEDNQKFRRALEAANYGHTYMEAPGDHEWPYWDKAIQYALQFFCGLDPETTPIY